MKYIIGYRVQDKIKYIRFRSIGIGIDQFYPVRGLRRMVIKNSCTRGGWKYV